MIPYGKHDLHPADREALLEVLDTGWLTGGPTVAAFEADLAKVCGAPEVVCTSSGTTALHLVAESLGAPPGAWWICPSSTFVATVQAGVYAGYRPVFADVDPLTGLICCESVAQLLEAARDHQAVIAAVVAVDLNGHSAPIQDLADLLDLYAVPLIRDAAHSLGGVDSDGQNVGACERVLATMFSFHPVKLIAAAEGGAVASHDLELLAQIRHLRSHAMTRAPGSPSDYSVDAVGYNYRLSDLHAALGRSQLARIDEKLALRRGLAAAYQEQLDGVTGLRLVRPPKGSQSAWHLVSILVASERRWPLISSLREAGIGVAHHYPAAHLQPVYKELLPGLEGTCPGAESYCASQITLPLFETLTLQQVTKVTDTLKSLL
jgi:dTDP-4-amino-4,6-dideoxygalactose transaminase